MMVAVDGRTGKYGTVRQISQQTMRNTKAYLLSFGSVTLLLILVGLTTNKQSFVWVADDAEQVDGQHFDS